MHATTLSFRAGDDFAEQTRSLANFMGMKSSDYIRQAVREKNEQVMAQRIASLSKMLSAEHLSVNESLAVSLADGLTDGLN
jgi:predicted transcriptional regulator